MVQAEVALPPPVVTQPGRVLRDKHRVRGIRDAGWRDHGRLFQQRRWLCSNQIDDRWRRWIERKCKPGR